MKSLLNQYHSSDIAKANKSYLQQIRSVLDFIDPSLYRGIGRIPLKPWSPQYKEDRDEITARMKFFEINGEDREEWDMYVGGYDYSKSLISTFEQAHEIYSHLISPKDYEIVHLSREVYEENFELLGYDIGCWGGEFSLISDTIVMPRWHPPAPADLVELSSRVNILNKYVLFQTLREAQEFKQYYLSKSWAEAENSPGEFCIIQLALTAYN